MKTICSIPLTEQNIIGFIWGKDKEIVKKIRVRTILENENGEFWHKIGEIDLETSINEKRHRKYGRCYTYYPDASLLKLGVYYMEFYL